uniref:Uncharacterized protein n=1 Tax=Cannabis sativa TaxID=3483 RepID=A0A803PNT7_CANSA
MDSAMQKMKKPMNLTEDEEGVFDLTDLIPSRHQDASDLVLYAKVLTGKKGFDIATSIEVSIPAVTNTAMSSGITINGSKSMHTASTLASKPGVTTAQQNCNLLQFSAAMSQAQSQPNSKDNVADLSRVFTPLAAMDVSSNFFATYPPTNATVQASSPFKEKRVELRSKHHLLLQNGSKIRYPFFRHRRRRLFFVLLYRSPLSRTPSDPVQFSPDTASPPEASHLDLTFSHDSLRRSPSDLLYGGLGHRVRRHCGAPRDRIDPGQSHRGSPTRGVPPWASERAVHNRGFVFGFYVCAGWSGDCVHGSLPRSQSSEEREGLVCLSRDLLTRHCLYHEYALYSHQNSCLS